MSVPYSLLIEQPYTPQSWLDARTIARATWLSSPPLGKKGKRKEKKHNHEHVKLIGISVLSNFQDSTASHKVSL